MTIPTSKNSNLTQARGYAERGWEVFPCKPRDKRPATRHGLHDGSTDIETVDAWWSDQPERNVAIVTGAASGIVVVDIDGPEGEATATSLDLPETLTANTGRGRHLYYAHPGAHLKGGAGESGGLGKGVDLRADGQYVVAPPSVHPSGASYEWAAGCPDEPAPLPEWILEARGGRQTASSSGPVLTRLRSVARSRTPVEPDRSILPHSPVPVGTTAGLDRLAVQYELLASAETGNRNARLNEVAHVCGTLVASGHVSEGYVEKVVSSAAGFCELVHDDGPDAVARTYESGLRSGKAKPQEATGYLGQAGAWVKPREPGRRSSGGRTGDGRLLWTWDDLQAMPATDYLIEGVVPERGLMTLFAPPASYKTFVALDWALSIASGRPWDGRATKPGTVVYVAAEGAAGLRARIQAWAEQHPTFQPWSRLRILPRTVHLGQPESVRELTAALRDELSEKPALVVIDTLARSTAGLEENSSKDMGAVVGHVESLVQEFGATVLLVHHTPRDAPDRERGSTAIEGAMDMRWLVRARGERVELICKKNKDGEDGQVLNGRMQPTGQSLVLDMSIDARARLENAQTVAAVKEAMALRRKDSKDGWPSLTEVRQHLNVHNARAKERLHAAAANPDCPVFMVEEEGGATRFGLKPVLPSGEFRNGSERPSVPRAENGSERTQAARP